MAKFIKKPVAIEAMQLPNVDEVAAEGLNDWLNQMDRDWVSNRDGSIVIHTLEGDHLGMPGDYIIKGINGEYYPCKPDIFKQTYYTEEEYAAL